MDLKIKGQYEEILDILDRYIFLMELSTMISAQGFRVYNFRCKELDDFMCAIENLMNYMNTIYTLREYARGFSKIDAVYDIQERYYNNNLWYRFLIDYRDCSVHDFALPRSYCRDNGELIIQLDEVIKKQAIIQKGGKANKFVNKRIKRLEYFKENVLSAFSASHFAEKTSYAVLEMAKEMMDREYDQHTSNNIVKLIKLSQESKNEEIINSVENFYVNVFNKLDHNGQLFKKIKETYIKNNYIDFTFYDSSILF